MLKMVLFSIADLNLYKHRGKLNCRVDANAHFKHELTTLICMVLKVPRTLLFKYGNFKTMAGNNLNTIQPKVEILILMHLF